MDLPVLPPVKPMLAKAATKLPVGDGVYYEPKWDGFRCVVFRDGDEVELGSRNERPLTRYFPEVVAAVKANLPEKCVVDGEIVVPRGDRLHFEDLLQRIHPAESRVNLLAEQTPASFVAFDLLALGDESLLETPVRRAAGAAGVGAGRRRRRRSTSPRVTRDADTAQRWFETFEGAGLDGVVAKTADLPYGPDQRLMTKVKHVRTADCVVAGFRWHKSGPIVGSLLLGLYNDAGDLQHIGVAASFPMARRAELVEELAPYRANALDGHPWQDWANAQVHGRRRAPDARRGQPVEREEGPVVGAAAPGTGRGDQVRPARRASTSSHRAVPPVAARPGRAELHLRPAGGAGALRPGRGAGRLSVPPIGSDRLQPPPRASYARDHASAPRPGGRPSSLLAIGLAATLALSGCTSFSDTVAGRGVVAAGEHVAAEPKAAPIDWSDCNEQIQPLIAGQPGSDRNLTFECGRTEVPISYDEPKGATLPLFLVRVVMAGQTDRIGSLVVNPGGPGASGADAAIGLALTLPTDV